MIKKKDEIMKNTKQNIFIIHSLNGDTLEFWGKDIKTTFENKIEVMNKSDFQSL